MRLYLQYKDQNVCVKKNVLHMKGVSFKSWLIVQSAFDKLEKRAVIAEPYLLRAAFIMTVS